jgi:hypothetical protein
MKLRDVLTGAGLTAGIVLATPMSALAAWNAGSTEAMVAVRATALPASLPPSVRKRGSALSITWPMTKGFPVRGYRVARIDSVTDEAVAAGGNCAGLLTVTGCTERDVPAGSWSYQVVAVVGENWMTRPAVSDPVLVSAQVPAVGRVDPPAAVPTESPSPTPSPTLAPDSPSPEASPA